ncbi:hypothetical protein BJV82DRAFT_579536 [Fennellomyces sp. T-0311]|nr:hypothetical protein BJV82DRAFT_579536 [Fennellomyces sp. T-0311]
MSSLHSQPGLLPQKRKHEDEIDSLLPADIVDLLSTPTQLSSADNDFMQQLLLLSTMPIDKSTLPTKDDMASVWRPDGFSIDDMSASFLNDLSSANMIHPTDCLQDAWVAPPSSVLPVDNDWFLLDDAPLFHEEPVCPSSPASSSASDELTASPVTPPTQTQSLVPSNPGTEWKSLLQQYLGQPESSGPAANERTVMIITGKVAQKSYGTEKRFLCPPPTTVVIGGTSPLNFRISAGGPKSQQTGVLDRTSDNYFKCTSKNLHINDLAEKRKQVTVTVDINRLGTFISKPIKVISKPSKKKQSSVKHLELCIHHGSTIALFNRIRSQTVSTKYLGVNEPKTTSSGTLSYAARPSSWDPFVIWAVDGEPGPIHYNQHVTLQCMKTGVMSPVMVLRKGTLRQQSNELGDPVSQLHRVAFEVASNNNQYLACINDTVLTAALDPVSDTAIWTIIGTDCATFTFWTPNNTAAIVTPFPEVRSVAPEGKDRLLLLGNQLSQLLTVWLGDVKCCSLSYSHSNDSIVCIIPPTDVLAASSACTRLDNDTRRLPVFLVREADGTVYRTNHFYTF